MPWSATQSWSASGCAGGSGGAGFCCGRPARPSAASKGRGSKPAAARRATAGGVSAACGGRDGGLGGPGEGLLGEVAGDEVAEVRGRAGAGEERRQRIAAERQRRPAGDLLGGGGDGQAAVDEDGAAGKQRGGGVAELDHPQAGRGGGIEPFGEVRQRLLTGRVVAERALALDHRDQHAVAELGGTLGRHQPRGLGADQPRRGGDQGDEPGQQQQRHDRQAAARRRGRRDRASRGRETAAMAATISGSRMARVSPPSAVMA